MRKKEGGRERETERQRDTERKRERERERKSVWRGMEIPCDVIYVTHMNEP